MKESYHFIGIGGIGMSGLARILLAKKYAVSGSDLQITPLIEALIAEGAFIHKGQSANHISKEATVIYGSDIQENNPEYAAALEKECKVMHRADLLANLIKESRSLAVAGTHGKTTTSALLTSVLFEAGTDPSFAVGGILPQFQSNARCGWGDFFVLEADESDQTFLKYSPLGAIVTNIDHDHLINYQGKLENLIAAFKTFISQVQSARYLFWCGDDVHLKDLHLEGESYGLSEDCRWHVSNVRQVGFQLIFDLRGPYADYKNIELALIGVHNACNAAAVFGLAINLGIEEGSIRNALRNFQGVLRRCEKKGFINGILFLDDYAHHPAEITATLQAIKQAIGEKRLVAVFQPHRYSRTQECLGQFGACFAAADEVIVTDIYGAGETPILSLSGETIMQEIKGQSAACQYIPRTAVSHKLSQCLQPDDVVVTLGAGDINKVAGETMLLLDRSDQQFRSFCSDN